MTFFERKTRPFTVILPLQIKKKKKQFTREKKLTKETKGRFATIEPKTLEIRFLKHYRQVWSLDLGGIG